LWPIVIVFYSLSRRRTAAAVAVQLNEQINKQKMETDDKKCPAASALMIRFVPFTVISYCAQMS